VRGAHERERYGCPAPATAGPTGRSNVLSRRAAPEPLPNPGAVTDRTSGSGAGRARCSAAATRRAPNVAASMRSPASILLASATVGASGPSSSGTSTERSNRAMSVPIVVSALKGTVPVTASMRSRASA